MENNNSTTLIINSFCYVRDQECFLISLYNEKERKLNNISIEKLLSFGMDDCCIILVHQNDKTFEITPIKKIILQYKKEKTRVKAKNIKLDNLIDYCYKACIITTKTSKEGI